jgi:hypothetical protein
MRDSSSPFKQGCLSSSSHYFALDELVQLFAEMFVLPAFNSVSPDKELLKGCAIALATEVCSSNTAEKLAYTIQQLMHSEKDQKYERFSRWPFDQTGPKNTTFQDLEAWATKAGDGTVTVDTDRLKQPCEYVEQQMYAARGHQWAQLLLGLYKDYFSKDQSVRVNEVVRCSDVGLTLVLCYVDSDRLAQLASLSTLWDFSTQAPDRTVGYIVDHNIIHCAVVIEDDTMIVEAAVASLTDRYSESVRQRLITQLLVLKWLATAVLSKSIVPATSLQVLGHIVVDYQPGFAKKPPALTNKMVPDYQDIPITLHNLYFA